ncbi:MAG TPA: Gfo/Idh/MocA family oxidoreductase [Thermoguttaceae bacterium]|nr:Gfo/Idh/MocA family oxidoreductase [Thermoguttaceae bacterium]
MKLRVGLVGLGDSWQQRHAPALRALADRFVVRAVCEQVQHRAEQAAAEFDAAAVTGYRALARREDIDVVLILSPQWYGALPILAACESGKAIYCAAGLDLEPETARLVKRRVEESGIVFMAEFPRRQAPATLRLKELIATVLGQPRLLFCHQRSVAKLAVQPQTNCSAFHVQLRDMIELVDWCRYVVDKDPTFVTGLMHAGGHETGAGDYQMMSLDFSAATSPGTGPVAQISCGQYIPAGWQEAITYRPLAALQVSCERGIAFIDLPATLVWFDEAGRHQESLENERPVGEQLLSQFHRVVTNPVGKTCDLEDAYCALNIVQQARNSHVQGRRIEL